MNRHADNLVYSTARHHFFRLCGDITYNKASRNTTIRTLRPGIIQSEIYSMTRSLRTDRFISIPVGAVSIYRRPPPTSCKRVNPPRAALRPIPCGPLGLHISPGSLADRLQCIGEPTSQSHRCGTAPPSAAPIAPCTAALSHRVVCVCVATLDRCSRGKKFR